MRNRGVSSPMPFLLIPRSLLRGGFITQQMAINERLTAAIERLDVTQARIETLLARMLPQGENGREA